MIRNTLWFMLLAAFLLGACSRVQEPWVEGGRLLKERTRPAEQAQSLQHRLLRVQEDR